MDLDLQGRGVLVTGGSAGVGLATVRLLEQEGAQVAVCARDGARLRRAVPMSAYVQACDVLDRTAAESFVTAAAHSLGRLDAVVAVAGQGVRASALETSDADWVTQLAGKSAAVLNVVRPALPHLERSDAPRVVGVGSVTATEPEPGLAASSAGRAAAAAVLKVLAHELAPKRVLVNVVAVGVVDTERQREAHARSGAQVPYGVWLQQEVLRRGALVPRAATADEVARQLVLLASPVTTYSTGSSFDVSGGMRRSL